MTPRPRSQVPARRAPAPADLRALLVRARAGDRDAFDRLAVHAIPRLLGAAQRLLGEASEAEEAVAEALGRAYLHLSRFRGEAAFTTWTHRILLREVVNRWRSRGRDHRRLDRLRDLARLGTAPPAGREAERVEQALGVRAAVDALPPRQRLVVVLHLWEGLDLREVASLMGVRHGTAKSHLHHARDALRRVLPPEPFA